jgi:7,8-dihydroneopterin aldolase/epimerase/oxygenase
LKDWIRILDLPLRCRIGVPDAERAAAQELRLDLALQLDIKPAADADDFSQTIDYAAVAGLAQRLASSRDRRLIETLAEELAAAILAEFPAQSVRLTIRKPGALIAFGAKAAAVEVLRERRG